MLFVGTHPALYRQDNLMNFRVAAGVDQLKLGITSWAQINVRDSISIKKKAQLEQEYFYMRSTLFDIEIIIKSNISCLI